MTKKKPKLHIFVKQATHFLEWERLEFEKYFNLVNRPAEDTLLMVFGPDALEEGAKLPALKRFATLFPGFGHNPLYSEKNQSLHRGLIENYYDRVYINPGPLELAYKNLDNVEQYPFSVDTRKVTYLGPRKSVKRIVHVSSDYPQKDWIRSQEIMEKTGLRYEVFPPRDDGFYEKDMRRNALKNKMRRVIGLTEHKMMPKGYVEHSTIVKKYQKNDAFIHVARDIKDEVFIDGKYTACLIEAGLTGCILFWHDTFGLGNNLETVFSLPLDTDKAAAEIKRILASIDIEEHSRKTHEEMLRVFNPEVSVRTRAESMLGVYNK